MENERKVKSFKKILDYILRRDTVQIFDDVPQYNYEGYKKEYDTLKKVSETLGDQVYITEGLAVPVQTNQFIYRYHKNLNILCRYEDLAQVIKKIKKMGYIFQDKRGARTKNIKLKDGTIKKRNDEYLLKNIFGNMLDIGISTYKIREKEAIVQTYYYDEEEKLIEEQKVMPLELFYLYYPNEKISYKNLELMSESKESIYRRKQGTNRPFDETDNFIIEDTSGLSEKRLERMDCLEKRVTTYITAFSRNGQIVYRRKIKPEEPEDPTPIKIKLTSNLTGVYTSNGYNQEVNPNIVNPNIIVKKRNDLSIKEL